MIIGTFTKIQDGGYHGSINTPGLNLDGVVFEKQDKGAAFILSAEHNGHAFEIGAAWEKDGDYGPYLSVKLDSPLFTNPINANMKLKASDAGLFALTWNRPKPKTED